MLHFNGSGFILQFLVSDYKLKPFPEIQRKRLKFFHSNFKYYFDAEFFGLYIEVSKMNLQGEIQY